MSLKTDHPIPADVPKRHHAHNRLVRISAYSVTSVLALMMTTAVLPPLLADQSDRAVINAPISLLTAPIAGEVRTISLQVGQFLSPGESVAHIYNGRVDRTTLITLDGKVEELRGSLLAARQKIASDQSYIDALDAEIRRQAEQTVAKLEGEVAEAKARVGSADAESRSTRAVVARQQTLVNRDVASQDFLKPTQHKLEAASFDKEAEIAKLDQKLAELNAVRNNVFVGTQSNNLALLSQKRRDLSFNVQHLVIEEAQLVSSLKSQVVLLEAEQTRLDSMTDAQMRAANGGVVLTAGVAQGRHVSPGDAVTTLIDCDQAFVVGIFSYRQAQKLAVGTRVQVSAVGGDKPYRGHVSEILPKTNDKTDQQYAVPFPQTERREMYVLVSLDSGAKAALQNKSLEASRTSPCSVGQWVTVTRENSWLPSASVAWTTVAEALTGYDHRPTGSLGTSREKDQVMNSAISLPAIENNAETLGARTFLKGQNPFAASQMPFVLDKKPTNGPWTAENTR